MRTLSMRFTSVWASFFHPSAGNIFVNRICTSGLAGTVTVLPQLHWLRNMACGQGSWELPVPALQCFAVQESITSRHHLSPPKPCCSFTASAGAQDAGNWALLLLSSLSSVLLSLSLSHPPKAPGVFFSKAVKCCWFRLWELSGDFSEWGDGKVTSHFARRDCQWGGQDECHGAFPGTNSSLGWVYSRSASCFSQFGVKARSTLLSVILWLKCSLHEQAPCSGADISWAGLLCWWGYPGARETLIFWVLLGQAQRIT